MVGTFPDGNSALMLVCARLRHVAGTQWGCKKYMNMKHLEAVMDDASTCQKFNCICIVEIISCGSHFFLGVFPCFYGICRQLSAFRCF